MEDGDKSIKTTIWRSATNKREDIKDGVHERKKIRFLKNKQTEISILLTGSIIFFSSDKTLCTVNHLY